ncbi:hypothetical protein CEUSTIGMA_g13919.t1, partial [Chlamydomonas eustigma]
MSSLQEVRVIIPPADIATGFPNELHISERDRSQMRTQQQAVGTSLEHKESRFPPPEPFLTGSDSSRPAGASAAPHSDPQVCPVKNVAEDSSCYPVWQSGSNAGVARQPAAPYVDNANADSGTYGTLRLSRSTTVEKEMAVTNKCGVT